MEKARFIYTVLGIDSLLRCSCPDHLAVLRDEHRFCLGLAEWAWIIIGLRPLSIERNSAAISPGTFSSRVMSRRTARSRNCKMRKISIAVTQMTCSWDREANVRRAGELVEEAASKGAQVVLLQELFETPYFCIEIDKAHYRQATTISANPAIRAMRKLAAERDVVVPVSFYEQAADGRRFNSLAVIDAGGDILGVYRKSHIPDFPAYEEAFYFDPGDTGFKVWDTKYVRLGCGICWDQWFPESARIMALMGAELLMYPTAIGRPTMGSADEIPNSKPHWQITMQGPAAANHA